MFAHIDHYPTDLPFLVDNPDIFTIYRHHFPQRYLCSTIFHGYHPVMDNTHLVLIVLDDKHNSKQFTFCDDPFQLNLVSLGLCSLGIKWKDSLIIFHFIALSPWRFNFCNNFGMHAIVINIEVFSMFITSFFFGFPLFFFFATTTHHCMLHTSMKLLLKLFLNLWLLHWKCDSCT